MPGIPASLTRQVKSAIGPLLTHSYTRTPMADSATENDWGDAPSELGTPATGVRCLYLTANRTVRDETGVTIVSVPTLMVEATDPLQVGDEIDAVTDKAGAVIAAGPFRVERLMDDTSGFGVPVFPTYELLATRTLR